ncbi:hypothetical protein ABEB33_23285 [Herbaspirillum huttiense]|uniref:hypothetical protein n=1 Tax=Herbaspirillum huttiense TaxID=863372 RepID=UPI003877D503
MWDALKVEPIGIVAYRDGASVTAHFTDISLPNGLKEALMLHPWLRPVDLLADLTLSI